MKITDSEVIKNGEKDLIDAITADLDWAVIEEIFLKEHNLGIEEDIEFKRGDIVSSNNQIAYKLEFEVKVNLSILLDRNGDYLSIAISGDKDTIEPEDAIKNGSDNIHDSNNGTLLGEDNRDMDQGDLNDKTPENDLMEMELQVGEIMEKISSEQGSSNENR